MPLIDLTNENFDEQIETHTLAVFDFWASWCGPCKNFAPLFEAAAQKFPQVLFAKINVDEQPILAQQFEVKSIPTLLAAREGTIVEARVGAMTPKDFELMLQRLTARS